MVSVEIHRLAGEQPNGRDRQKHEPQAAQRIRTFETPWRQVERTG